MQALPSARRSHAGEEHLSRLGLWMSVESTFISVYSQVCLEMRRAS